MLTVEAFWFTFWLFTFWLVPLAENQRSYS
jgi:hypothetical protein